MGKDDREDEDRREEDGEGRRGDGERGDEWLGYELQPIPNNISTPYGFVIDHFAYWGIPLFGFQEALQPSQPAEPGSAPRTLKVSDVEVRTNRWTGGDLTITATRTPPLFHAFHHKTDASLNGSTTSPFERRSERNIIERDYSPVKAPLPGKGIDACVKLFDVTFNASGRANSPARVGDIPFSRFDTRGQIPAAISKGYFDISGGVWNTSAVGPLNALWFVIFSEGTKNLPVNRLGDDYRLWHHRGSSGTTHGYDWKIWQKNNFQKIRVEVRLAGDLNPGLKECPDEDVRVSYELEWV